jgi:hypothetical protein
MAKILIGLIAAIAVAVAGFFGFAFYTQHRVAGDVEAAFDRIRATGTKASHGKVSFNLWNRTVAIADIATESTAQPSLGVKIASFAASGVSQPDATRFSADTIEASGVEIGATMADQAGWRLSYKVPRITIKDYSGPASLQQQPASSSAIDVYRFALEQLAAVTASSITAPSLTGTVNFGAATMDAGDFVYSGLALNDIKDGKIASMKVDRMVFTANMQQTGNALQITGEIANVALVDFDAGAAAAVLDPQKANDDRIYRVYRQVTAGPYTVTSGQGLRFVIDGMTVDDIGVRPSRMRLPALMAAIPPSGMVPTPAQARDMIEKLAGIYEGTRIGNAELRGLSIETPEGPFKLSAIRLNLENGKIGELALEGLDMRSPAGPIKVGRFALKSFDVAGLLRMSALFTKPAQPPPPEQFIVLLRLLEGIEVKGLVVPYKNTARQVSIETFNLNWGQFVGPIPSKTHLTAKLSVPVDAADPNQTVLIAAGIDTLVLDFDLGAAWTEASRTFALELATAEVGGVLKASAGIALSNVPREVFSVNPLQAATAAAQIEVGPMQVMLRDLGGVDLAVAQYARIQNVGPDEARRAIVDNIRATGAQVMTTSPDAAPLVDALARFIENPKGTLTLKLTPRAKVPAMQLFQALKIDPSVALAQFQVEVSTGR